MDRLTKAAMKALWSMYDEKNDPPKSWTKVSTQFELDGKKYKVEATVKDGTDSPIATKINVAELKVK